MNLDLDWSAEEHEAAALAWREKALQEEGPLRPFHFDLSMTHRMITNQLLAMTP